MMLKNRGALRLALASIEIRMTELLGWRWKRWQSGR